MVSIFAVKEVSGLDYMAFYRNPEALALLRRLSARPRREREIGCHLHIPDDRPHASVIEEVACDASPMNRRFPTLEFSLPNR